MAKAKKEGAEESAPIDKYRQPDKSKPAAAAAAAPADPEAGQLVQQLKQESPRVLKAIALARPFAPSELKWKPGMVKGTRCLAMVYIDARLVMDRLDEVFGFDGWGDEYAVLEGGGSVACTITVYCGAAFGHLIEVKKTDVGSPSDQPDKGDRLKAAYSDALKRAAVKLGVGRYLYRIPSQWVDYDPVKRQITRPPKLPDFAIPKAEVPPPSPGYYDPLDEVAAAATNATAGDGGPEWKGDKLPERPAAGGNGVAAAATALKKAAGTDAVAAAATPSANGNNNGNGKPHDVVPAEKRDSAWWVNEWRRKLVGFDTPEELNKGMVAFKSVPNEFKATVRDFILEEIRSVGWEYDADQKLFFKIEEKDEVGEAIPF